MKPRFAHTQNAWEGHNYNQNLSTKEIAAKLRQYCKEKYPSCKFSITSKYFSGGSEINIHFMAAPFNPAFQRRNRIYKNGIETWEYYPFNGNAQLNHHFHGGFDGSEGWNNGTQLTQKCWDILEDTVHTVQSYNFDDSDSMIDYFHTNFYLHLEIGRWDKPFKITT